MDDREQIVAMLAAHSELLKSLLQITHRMAPQDVLDLREELRQLLQTSPPGGRAARVFGLQLELLAEALSTPQ